MKQLVSLLPWGHLVKLLLKVKCWETKIVKALPKKLDGILPTIAEIEAEFKDEV